MRLLAIDFGTSNTVAALSVDGQAPRTVTFDASPLLPSSVYIAADGQVVTGREAQRQARLDPTRSLDPQTQSADRGAFGLTGSALLCGTSTLFLRLSSA